MNIAILTGNIGQRPQISTFNTESGAQTGARFSIAVQIGFGESRKTEWWTVKATGKTAEFVRDWLVSGDSVTVKGKLRASKYTDKDGNERTDIHIFADEIDNHTWKKKTQAEQATQPPAPKAQANAPQPPAPRSIPPIQASDEDDLPF